MKPLSLRIRFLAVLAALGLVAAGCVDGTFGDSESFAAKVNGQTITIDELESELDEINANDEYVTAIETDGSVGPVRGEGDGTFASAFVAEVLRRQIIFAIFEAELDDRGVELTDADIETAREQVAGQVGGPDVYEAFSEDYQQLLAFRTAQVNTLITALSDVPQGDDAAEEYYEENQDEFAEACAHHILVNTEEEAADVLDRLESGEAFETVAEEVSIDTGSGSQGGNLDCAPRGVYVPEFEEAVFSQPVGEIGEPVQSTFGFHIIRVDDRRVPPFEEVAGQVQQRLQQAGQEAFSLWLTTAFDEADVEVDPRYGTWDTSGFQPIIVPPEAPQVPTPGEGGGVDDLFGVVEP